MRNSHIHPNVYSRVKEQRGCLNAAASMTERFTILGKYSSSWYIRKLFCKTSPPWEDLYLTRSTAIHVDAAAVE